MITFTEKPQKQKYGVDLIHAFSGHSFMYGIAIIFIEGHLEMHAQSL